MTTLITGGAGFIGRHMVAELLRCGKAVTVLTRKASPSSIPGAALIVADLFTGHGLDQVPWAEVSEVVHLAAAGVKSADRSWPDCVQTNLLGTARLLDHLSRFARHCPPVLAAATYYERDVTCNAAFAVNPYITTKAASSDLMRLWSRSYGGPVILATIFHVFGPGDHPANVVSYACQHIKAGRPCVFGLGDGKRDWLYIADAVAGLRACLAAAHSGFAAFDIGSGQFATLREVLTELISIARGDPRLITFAPEHDRGDANCTYRAEHLPPAWSPAISLHDGLALTYSLS